MHCIGDSKVVFGLEATGHYWLSIFSFLLEKGYIINVINPIQSDSFRNLYIRQTKNDTKDSFIIAEVIRFGRFTTTQLADEKIQDAAKNTFGIKFAHNVFKFQLKQLIEQVLFIENQIKDLDDQIEFYYNQFDSHLESIPGIGKVTAVAHKLTHIVYAIFRDNKDYVSMA